MKKFLQIFINNSGFWVSFSMLFTKFSAFLITVVIARLLSSEDLGTVLYALNFLGFFIPLIGMGSYQGTLRYGSMYSSQDDKKNIINYSFYYGFIGQMVLTVLMMLISLFSIKEMNVVHLVLVFGIRLVGVYLMEQAKVNFRALGNNKKFALSEIYYALISIVLCVSATFVFGIKGYIVALCLSPFFIVFYHRFQFKKSQVPFNQKEFWKFCLFSAFTLQIWQWVFLLDVFFVGYFFTNSDVTHYKLSAMIPFNLMFISQSLLQTEYPNLCKNHDNRAYFIKFLKNYYILFTIINSIILIIAYSFTTQIMAIFGQKNQDPQIFLVLIWVTVLSAFFRTLFGNLLPCIGKSAYNLVVAGLSLVVLSIGSFYLYEPYGLVGIAYASLIAFTVSGALAMFLFFVSLPKAT